MKLHRAMKPDGQGFDEVRIVTVPRFKESELSGDEWRISARIEFLRKGQVVHTAGSRNIETMLAHGSYHHSVGLDEAKGLFCGERDVCDQEGCCERGDVVYALKNKYDRDGKKTSFGSRDGEFRVFCSKHSTRGDCGLEDADDNYVELPGALLSLMFNDGRTLEWDTPIAHD